MPELMKSAYYWMDLSVGFGGLILFYLLYKLKWIEPNEVRFFLSGTVIGLAWEVPIFVLSKHSSFPLIMWMRALPLPYVVFLIAHTLWDGLIFFAGVFLVRLFCRTPHFASFRWSELAVLLAWGQISAFLVECSSVLNDGWIYVEGYSWNPTLFRIAGHPITILPQSIWMIAPVVFYAVSLRLNDE